MKKNTKVPKPLNDFSMTFNFNSKLLYDHWSVSIVLQPSPFFSNSNLTTILLLIIVQARNQLENLSKDQPIDKDQSLENFKNEINSKFSELNDRFSDFDTTYEMGNSNLLV